MEVIDPAVSKNYKVVRKVGKGAYGVVWEVASTNTKEGERLALKKIFDAFSNQTDAQRTYRELQIQKGLNHPNIIKIKELLHSQSKLDLYFVMEYMQADLARVVRSSQLLQHHRKHIAYQLTAALCHLHKSGVLHRDLKPTNILVNSDCTAKLCDFGLSRTLESTQTSNAKMTELVTTRQFCAPQILLGNRKYNSSIDVWSLGCVVAFLYLKKGIFQGNSNYQLIDSLVRVVGKPSKSEYNVLGVQLKQIVDSVSVKQSSFAQIMAGVPKQAVDFIKRCLQLNPRTRLSAEQLLQHPYLASRRNAQLQNCQCKPVRLQVSQEKLLQSWQYRQLLLKDVKKTSEQESIERPLRQRQHLLMNEAVHQQPQTKNKVSKVSYFDKKLVSLVPKNKLIQQERLQRLAASGGRTFSFDRQHSRVSVKVNEVRRHRQYSFAQTSELNKLLLPPKGFQVGKKNNKLYSQI